MSTFDSTKPAYQGPLNSQPIRDNFNSLNTRLNVEHNADGSHKDVVKKTGDVSTGDQSIKKAKPALRLIGTETSARDVRIIEDAGKLLIQRNSATEANPQWVNVLSLDVNTNQLTIARIDESNLTDTAAIPDSKLATIATAGKIADTALPSNLARTGSANIFTQSQTLRGSNLIVNLENTVDTTYKVALFKTGTAGEFQLQIRRRSDDVVMTSLIFDLNGTLYAQNIRATQQLISAAPQGTPPLVVSSSTQVNNLKAQYAGQADTAVRLQFSPQVGEFPWFRMAGFTRVPTISESVICTFMVPQTGAYRIRWSLYTIGTVTDGESPEHHTPLATSVRFYRGGIAITGIISMPAVKYYAHAVQDLWLNTGDTVELRGTGGAVGYNGGINQYVGTVTINTNEPYTVMCWPNV